MASTKIQAAFLATLALCAYLITETDGHLKIGRKEFRPLRQELKELLQDRKSPAFRDNINGLDQRRKWKPVYEEIPELYWKETAEHKVINAVFSLFGSVLTYRSDQTCFPTERGRRK